MLILRDLQALLGRFELAQVGVDLRYGGCDGVVEN
jgi:hypothetical protein